MTDGPVGGPPPEGPGARALGAMESAVRRVRETRDPHGGPQDSPENGPAPGRKPTSDAPLAPVVPSPSPGEGGWRRPRPDRWLIVALGVVVTLVVIAGAGLAASLASGPSPSTPTPSGPTQASSPPGSSGAGHAAAGPGGAAAGTRSGTSTAPSTITTTTTTETPAPATGATPATTTTTTPATTTTTPAPGPAPVIAALVPATGAPGQGIEVAGANFLSPDGRITVTFDGRVAPTSCPTQDSCTVTVPPRPGSSTAQVTITTASGTSNAVTFTYS